MLLTSAIYSAHENFRNISCNSTRGSCTTETAWTRVSSCSDYRDSSSSHRPTSKRDTKSTACQSRQVSFYAEVRILPRTTPTSHVSQRQQSGKYQRKNEVHFRAGRGSLWREPVVQNEAEGEHRCAKDRLRMLFYMPPFL